MKGKSMKQTSSVLFAGIFLVSHLVLSLSAFGAETPQPIPVLLQGKLNLARTAKVEASSTEKGYTPQAVVDGVAQGYPEKGKAEWSSNGETTGAKVKLVWAEPVTIETVWLFDRPLPNVQVLDAQIDFSDGTSIMTGELPNDGKTPCELNFPAKTITWMEITVAEVRPNTKNVGFSEIAVFQKEPLCAETPAPSPANDVQNSPEWTKDLIIYEIATKAFTSPNGPESGTFNSLKEKVPHLKSLGINGIWLTGHSLSHSNHFYNIWTQYACIDPFKIDPSLGTPEEFKSLIDECHRNGIRVFVDVITHGLIKDSPLIKEHPSWFKGGSFEMTDYDWKSPTNKEWEAWWINGWVETVTRYSVDGFRLDCGGKRYDLWKEIRRRCVEAGHPVVIFPEPSEDPWIHDRVSGVTDFGQKYMKVADKSMVSFAPTNKACTDMAGLIHEKYNPKLAKGYYGSIQLSCHDEGWEGFPANENPYVAEDSRYLMGYAVMFAPAIPIFMSGEEWNCGFRPLPNLSHTLYGKANPGKSRWLCGSWIDWPKLNQPEQQAMLNDVTKMISIRKAHADLLTAKHISTVPNIASVAIEDGGATLPKPYIQWNNKKAILVSANPGDKPIQVRLKVLCDQLGWNCDKITVIDLWSGQAPVTVPISGGTKEAVIPVEIGADRTPSGGISVLLLRPGN